MNRTDPSPVPGYHWAPDEPLRLEPDNPYPEGAEPMADTPAPPTTGAPAAGKAGDNGKEDDGPKTFQVQPKAEVTAWLQDASRAVSMDYRRIAEIALFEALKSGTVADALKPIADLTGSKIPEFKPGS